MIGYVGSAQSHRVFRNRFQTSIFRKPPCHPEAGSAWQSVPQCLEKRMRTADVTTLDLDTEDRAGNEQSGQPEPRTQRRRVDDCEEYAVADALCHPAKRSSFSSQKIVGQVQTAERIQYHAGQTQNGYQITADGGGPLSFRFEWPVAKCREIRLAHGGRDAHARSVRARPPRRRIWRGGSCCGLRRRCW